MSGGFADADTRRLMDADYAKLKAFLTELELVK
jgi:hypothetical protein